MWTWGLPKTDWLLFHIWPNTYRVWVQKFWEKQVRLCCFAFVWIQHITLCSYTYRYIFVKINVNQNSFRWNALPFIARGVYLNRGRPYSLQDISQVRHSSSFTHSPNNNNPLTLCLHPASPRVPSFISVQTAHTSPRVWDSSRAWPSELLMWMTQPREPCCTYHSHTYVHECAS